MKKEFMIRLVLLVVCAANFYAAYLFFLSPNFIAGLYQLPPLDNTHRFFMMIISALFAVFGLGALLAFTRPRKYGAIIIMLLLMNFMIFLIDVIVLAQGLMPWKSVLPEMIYFLVISTALVRWYPVRGKEEKEAKEEKEVKEIKEKKKEKEVRIQNTNDSQEL